MKTRTSSRMLDPMDARYHSVKENGTSDIPAEYVGGPTGKTRHAAVTATSIEVSLAGNDKEATSLLRAQSQREIGCRRRWEVVSGGCALD